MSSRFYIQVKSEPIIKNKDKVQRNGGKFSTRQRRFAVRRKVTTKFMKK